jgi:hypothetical protein
MPAIPGSVPITGFIAPTTNTDTYPVIDPIWGIDGLRSVADATARDAITAARRRAGMVVFTQNTGEYWTLLPGPWSFSPTDWVLFTGGGGGAIIAPPTVIGVNVIDTIPGTTAADMEWKVVAQKGAVRLSMLLRVNHDGVDVYYIPTDVALTPGTLDVAITADYNAGNMRLIVTTASLGWQIRYTRQYLPV